MFLHRTSRMVHRLYAAAALVSAVAFVAASCCFVRTWRACEDWEKTTWDSSTRTLTETSLWIRGSCITFHSESTTAPPGDNVAPLVTALGPMNGQLVHSVWPGRPGADGPWLWADHYRSTPTVSINTSGTSDCWTLQFRIETALILFGCLPALWALAALRRWQKRRAMGPSGFSVLVTSPPGGGTSLQP